jgi:hypothetical protein
MKLPSVYLYELRDSTHRLYLGDFTTAQGLDVVSADSRIKILHFFSNQITEVPDSLSESPSIGDVQRFLSEEIGLIDFDCTINDSATLSTHDDCECHFTFKYEASCKTAVSRVSPTGSSDGLWNILQTRAGQYVVVDSASCVRSFATFDEYLAAVER